MNFLSNFKYQYYLFQLENYDISRYLKLALRNFGQNKEQRQSLVWTLKLKAIVVLAIVLWVLTSIIGLLLMMRHFTFNLWERIGVLIIYLFVLSLLNFIYLIVASLVLYPLDYFLKNRIINRAKNKIKTFKNLKVIGIAGSYGKTTAKEIVAAVLSTKYKILETPDNINTPLGISELINTKLNNDIDIFIVEMGEYTKGDIKDICDIVHPTYSILTGINEAHFERMGSLENAVGTIFELVENSNGPVLLNADDRLIVENYKKYAQNRGIQFYSAYNSELSEYKINNKVFKEDASGFEFNVFIKDVLFGEFKSKLLGEYSLGTIISGMILGKIFDIPIDKIRLAIVSLKPVAHRLEPIINSIGTIVIDDSYNGNPDGVRKAIKLLKKFSKRRKVYITPGLVETGPKAQEIHLQIGKELGKVADVVILIKNSVCAYIVEGLMAVDFPKENIYIFNSALEAHGHLAGLIKKDDVVLFQNDWPDNYL